MPAPRPLIAHLVYRLDVGGLENGLVNLINNMPVDRYAHTVIAFTEATDFRYRIRREDVPVLCLRKRAGKDFGAYVRLWRTLRQLRPDILHTRNLGTLDGVVPGVLAGVRGRVHGEHGRELRDVTGDVRKDVRLRRLLRPLIHTYIPMSKELAEWLRRSIGVDASKVRQIYNGVDSIRFHPQGGERVPLPVPGFADGASVIIGSVGRMDQVKDQLTLVRAFIRLLDAVPEGRSKLRLVHVGDGALMGSAKALLEEAGAANLAWFPGNREDVPCLLRALDIFVLPSLAEGICNTVLEAMATALPVVATRVGGNPELVEDGTTGVLVPPSDPEAMARALIPYIESPELRRTQGTAGRRRVEQHFTIERMVAQYIELYDDVLSQTRTLQARDVPQSEPRGTRGPN